MVVPWRCVFGHENRSTIPPEAETKSRRRLVLWCSTPGCLEHTSYFVGATEAASPDPAKRQGRRRKSES
ncbi:MAG TPA: hypothetical protein VMN82_17520 [Thermoanaerobaculia bacterium]|nr:hypothetical protein [Thermoanaerobaculia bacterium]